MNPSAVVAADFNEDGRPDVAVANCGSNTVTVFPGDGTGGFAAGVSFGVGVKPLAIAAADFDRDGHLDLATANSTSNTVSFLRGNGAGGFALATHVYAGLYARALVAADMNGDGRPDAAVGNANTNDAWTLLNTTGVGDLAVSITDGRPSATPGQALLYTIVVSNRGPADITGALVSTLVPPELTNVSWTCSASPGSSCPASGEGPIASTVDVRNLGMLIYAVSGTVAPDATGVLRHTVNVALPPDGTDPQPANNTATDSDNLGENHAPVARDGVAGTDEDVAVAATLAASDADGDPLTWIIVTPPAHGVLSGNAPALTYTPAADFHGVDTFTFKVTDGAADSNVATMTMDVASINDAPMASPQSVSTPKDTPADVALAGSDADGDSLTFAVVQGPAHGSLRGAAPNVTYTPDAGYRGSDTFTFTASDAQVTSQPALVTVAVTAPNSAPDVDAPIADREITDHSTATVVSLAGVFADIDIPFGDAVTYAVAGNPNGALVTPSLSGTTLTLGLAAGISGSATLTVRATDTAGASAEDSFVITVTRPPLAINIADASATEGNGGSKNLAFTVTLTSSPLAPVTVSYAATGDSATAGSDFTAVSGSLTFTPGAASRTFNVSILADLIDEDNETFTVTLSNVSGAAMGDGTAVGTITDDDLSKVSIGDASVAEGHAGIASATFTLTLTNPNSRAVHVDYATAGMVAASGADFTVTEGTMTFAPGTVSQTLVVPVLGDTLDEGNETFAVNLTNPVNGGLGDVKGVATIADDDEPPSVTIAHVAATELNATASLTFTLTLSEASGQTVKVQYATADGTAVAVSDYVARSGEVTFLPGVLTRTITVSVVGDQVAEPVEEFSVNLSAPTAVIIARPQATATITDNDGTL